MSNKESRKRNREYMREYREKNLFSMRKSHREYMKIWREKNREKLREYGREYLREWRIKNPNYQQEWRRKNPEYSKKWREENPEYHRQYQKERRKNNPEVHLNGRMSSAIYGALRGNKAGRRWETLVGYTVGDLISHLEAQFDENMFWHNYGTYWHIDYIKPRSSFSFEVAEDQEFRECWALKNLQPMEAIANIKKGNKYE